MEAENTQRGIDLSIDFPIFLTPIRQRREDERAKRNGAISTDKGKEREREREKLWKTKWQIFIWETLSSLAAIILS